MARRIEFDSGETCFITVPGITDPVEGHVITAFTHPAHAGVFYVIQLVDQSALHFEVRDALLMSRTNRHPRVLRVRKKIASSAH